MNVINMGIKEDNNQSKYLASRSLRILVILMCTCTVLSCGSQQTTDKNPDSSIITVIEDIFGKPFDQIPPEALQELSELSASGKALTSLKGIECLPGLIELKVGKNNFSDIGPLKELHNLKTLRAYDNKIIDISPLSEISTLESLTLAGNQIDDISPLSDLSNLYWLDLSKNRIRDVSPIAKLSNLSYVQLDNNQITDVSSMSSCVFVERNSEVPSSLYLSGNQISDISGLAGIGVKSLILNDNNITDIGAFVENPGKVTGINLKDNPLSLDAIKTQIPSLESRGIKVMH